MSAEDEPKVSEQQLLVYLIGRLNELHERMDGMNSRLDGHVRAMASIHQSMGLAPAPSAGRLMRAANFLLEWRSAITAVVTLVAAIIASRKK